MTIFQSENKPNNLNIFIIISLSLVDLQIKKLPLLSCAWKTAANYCSLNVVQGVLFKNNFIVRNVRQSRRLQ